MANPQIEHGHTRIANEILEQIMRVSLNGTQFRLVMAIWRYTYGFQRKNHEMSISFLVESINGSRSQVTRELNALIDRKIVVVVGTGKGGSRKLGFNKNHAEWDCTLNRVYPNQSTEVYSNQGTEVYPNQGTKKESIKENNKENIYSRVINYLNQKAGKRFSPKSAANKKLINGRIAEGRTFEDFIHVIDVKCEEWLDDPKWSEYLRPSTLFRPTNFENYLNQKMKSDQSQAKPDHRDKEIAFQQWIQEGNDPDAFDWGS